LDFSLREEKRLSGSPLLLNRVTFWSD